MYQANPPITAAIAVRASAMRLSDQHYRTLQQTYADYDHDDL